MELPSPAQIRREHPLSSPRLVSSWRCEAADILQRKDRRLVAIMGPCSIHDPKAAIEYAKRLKSLKEERGDDFFFIMRLFIEKPRTKLGWKGMLYDPRLDGSNDICDGLWSSRELMVKITEMGIPCAMEILEPIALPYFDDLLVWALVGARTSASQPHRQAASGLPFPVGFKNDCQGKLDGAIAGIATSRISHTHMGINSAGHVATIQTEGNPLSHLVLRGSDTGYNYDPDSIGEALFALREQGLQEQLVIDCSHGNCGKDYQRQQIAFASVIEQAATNRAIAGIMLESHLLSGKQPLGNDPSLLSYGISITDPCLSWEETEDLFTCNLHNLHSPWGRPP